MKKNKNKSMIKSKLFRLFFFLIIFSFVSVISALIINYIVMPAIEDKGDERILLSVTGLSWEKAASLLNREGFIPMKGKMRPVWNKKPFTILNQSPKAGSKVKMGRRVYLDMSTTGTKIAFPNLIGTTERSARINLEKQNMIIDTIYYRYSDKPRDVVFWQSITANDKVFPGTKVILKISLGLSKWVVPNLIDMSKKDAIEAIKNAGLQVGKITTSPRNDLLENTVLSQSISPNTKLYSRQRINLVISKFLSNYSDDE